MPLVNVNVHNIIVSDAIAALAFAGNDQSVLCASVVQLQGSITGDDIANHTFEWDQTFGTPVTLINANTLTPSFVNPQTSDLEFTLYIDRNTPYEDSDTVFISRAPQDAVTFFGEQGTKGLGGTGAVTQSNLASTNVVATDKGLRVLNPAVYGYSYTNPPEAKYNPIFKASDLDRVRKNVKGAYWLMNDIDLSDYDNWDPIGTAARPFSGELQGNGFKIENMTITANPLLQSVNGLDPFFDQVVLQLDMAGADGDTNTTDLSNSAHTVNFIGNMEIDDAQARYSATSVVGNGTTGYLSLPNSTDWQFGDGDWTMEGDFRFLDAANQTLFAQWDTGGQRSILIDTTSGGIRCYVTYNGFTTTNVLTTSLLNRQINTWYHIAVCRNGGNVHAFVNGVEQNNSPGTNIGSNTIFTGSIEDFTLGEHAGAQELNGWMDNIRITKGVARYTTDFAPTTDEFSYNLSKPAGLFSCIGSGTLIEKLGITDANISGVSSSLYKGILAGQATADVTVRNCYVDGTVASGGDLAGGLIGNTGTDAGSTFENTYADVTVTGGGTDTGGWAGTFDGTPTYVENYSNTTKTAAVVGTGAPGGTEVSGLIGAPYTGWDFVNIWDADSISGDPFYDGVSIFADFNGADEATAYTDETGNAWSFAGTGKLDNEYVKYGTTSITRGSDTTSSHVDYAYTTAIPTLGSNDFTIEVWGFWEGSLIGGNTFVTNNIPATNTPSWRFGVSTNILVFQYNKTGDDNTEDTFKVFGNVGSPGSWKHLAIQRNGTELRCFVNGVQNGATAAVGTDTIYKGTDHIALMREGNFGSASESVWMDDLRITVGSARYSTGGFTPPATANEFTPPSFATLQFDTNNNIRVGGFCDDQWMVQWGIPTYNNSTATPPSYIYKGAIVEERVAGGWSLPRFIPPERNAALMTPDTPHRVTAVWDFYYNTGFELRRFPSLYTAVKEVGVTDDRLFNSQNTSDRYGLYGTDSYTIGNGSASSSTNFTITISNPRKIAKTENELLTVNGGGAESTISSVTILRTTPIQKPTQDPGTFIGAGSASYSDNLTVTRVNGSSIG